MIAQNISDIQKHLPEHVLLVAVSKTHPEQAIQEAYACGVRHFGENKVQELQQKHAQLPADIAWHFIGHLQTNKVKYIAPFIHLIHGVDSFKLLQTIEKEGQKNKRVISCLLQFHIAQEETKFGLDMAEAEQVIEQSIAQNFSHVSIDGVMGMATYTDNQEQIRSEFATLRTYFKELQTKYFSGKEQFRHISMGMSQDFALAIEEGSTMVRIGSTIFGERFYG